MGIPERLQTNFWHGRSPAERILLCCTRQSFTAAWQERALRIASAESVRWDDVLATAVLHQVTPLIHKSLQSCPALATRVPADVNRRFREAVLLNIRRKHELADALRDALAFFGGYGIPVLLVKGTSLDVILYDEPWLTVSQDLDLILRADWDLVDEAVRQRVRDMNTERPLIDVHCQSHPDLVMNGLLPLDFSGILSRAHAREVHGHTALLMAVEDELLCACIQSFRKRFFRLKSLCEIAELVGGNPALDWDALAARAVAVRCHGIVYAALLAAHLSVGCALPPELRALLRVSRPHAALLHFLATRLSLSSLPTLFADKWLRGKMLGRGLLLPYASLGARKFWQSLRIVSGQTVAAGGGSSTSR